MAERKHILLAAINAKYIHSNLAEGLAIEDIAFVEALRGRIEHALRDMLGIGCKVKLLNEGTLPRSEGKAVRVEDTRNLG